MSALAQFHAFRGGPASGSDRSFDQGKGEEIRARLETLGIEVLPQDGSGAARCDALVVSTAVEPSVPDVREALARGIPILHRSELLARHVREHRTVAVTGTSGKSTVTAMLFELLQGGGLDPSVITGGDIVSLQARGALGNCWVGKGPWLVIEADESDGSLTRYEPWGGVLLNLERDHKEPEELREIFRTFRARTHGPFLAGEAANLDPLAAGAIRFGFGPGCAVRATAVVLEPSSSRFRIGTEGGCEADIVLPVPGIHNVANAAAATAAALACGLRLTDLPPLLARFAGVARRFQSLGTTGGVEVVDDFAHNPAKIAASLAAARPRGRRILAVYQPHGFGPTRFLRDGLVEALAAGLGAEDRLYMPEIFYAGGTAARDISSREITAAVAERGVPSLYKAERSELVPVVANDARPGDLVLVMGARDPSLTSFGRAILEALGSRGRGPGRGGTDEAR